MRFEQLMTGNYEIDLLCREVDGVNELVNFYWNDFSEAPASKGHHGNHKGGLREHCYRVYSLLKKFNDENNLEIPNRTLLLTSYFHDLCKVGFYQFINGKIEINPEMKNCSHAKLSLIRIKEYVELTELEENMIRFHMGYYGSYEFSEKYGEYSLSELTKAFNNPIVKLFYFCDDLEANILRSL